MRTTHVLFCCLLSQLLMWSIALAEKRTELRANPDPQVICSVCEECDLTREASCRTRSIANYCNCRKPSQSNTRVLYRIKSPQPYMEFKGYQSRRLRTLRARLVRQAQPLGVIRAALSALKRKLNQEHQGYLAQCVTPAVDPPAADFTLFREASGWSIYTLSNTGINSFALDITENGSILGGTYVSPPQRERGGVVELSATGITFEREEATQITPIVWTKEKAIPACTNCPPGLTLHSINELGQAVGTLRGRAPQAMNFNYKSNLLQVLPSTAGIPACATRVNEAGIVVGTLNCQLAQGGREESDVVAWVNGSLSKIERDTILIPFEEALKPFFLEGVKKQLQTMQAAGLECSTSDIELTKLIGRPKYEGEAADGKSVEGQVSVFASDINAQGDILGSIHSDKMSWRFSSPCIPDLPNDLPPELKIPPLQFEITPPITTFLRTAAGKVDIRIDGNPLNKFSPLITVPMTISNMGVALGAVSNGGITRPARIDLLDPRSKWTTIAVPDVRPEYSVYPRASNQKGDYVGHTFKFAPIPSDVKAFAVISGAFTDLNSLLGEGSDFVFRIATGINDRGEIVGRMENSKTGVSQVVLLTPKKCP